MRISSANRSNMSKMMNAEVKQRPFSCTLLAVSTANKDKEM